MLRFLLFNFFWSKSHLSYYGASHYLRCSCLDCFNLFLSKFLRTGHLLTTCLFNRNLYCWLYLLICCTDLQISAYESLLFLYRLLLLCGWFYVVALYDGLFHLNFGKFLHFRLEWRVLLDLLDELVKREPPVLKAICVQVLQAQQEHLDLVRVLVLAFRNDLILHEFFRQYHFNYLLIRTVS